MCAIKLSRQNSLIRSDAIIHRPYAALSSTLRVREHTGHRRVGRFEQFFGLFPAQASICDRHAVAERVQVGAELLLSFEEVALEHHADDVRIAGGTLLEHVVPHGFLLSMILLAV